MFFRAVFTAWFVGTLYIAWRTGSVPAIRRRVPFLVRLLVVAALPAGFVGARFLGTARWPLVARALEVVGVTSAGILFLVFVALLAADVLTGFGLFFRRHAARIRGGALVAAAGLSVLALAQGFRAPVIRDYEVALAHLPPDRDGTRVVFISDLHLGTLIGERWLAARVAQVGRLHPDMIVIGGDVLEGDDPSERKLLPLLSQLSAPLGVWAVTGNHDSHGRGDGLDVLERQGFHVLHNEWREVAPGLVIAGVDSGRTRPGAGPAEDRLERALGGRPPGAATIFVSHVPARVEDAAREGADLMLAAHTHDGQIWPFRYVVRLEYPYLAGAYDVGSMRLIVTRGTGTFGPRMRLWYPSEICRIILRARAAGAKQQAERRLWRAADGSGMR